jgi:hypothetical protein
LRARVSPVKTTFARSYCALELTQNFPFLRLPNEKKRGAEAVITNLKAGKDALRPILLVPEHHEDR